MDIYEIDGLFALGRERERWPRAERTGFSAAWLSALGEIEIIVADSAR